MASKPTTYTLTINIVGKGSPISPDFNGGTSDAGHMWYELRSSTGEHSAHGFAPVDDKTWRDGASAPGESKPDDHLRYIGEDRWSKQVQVSEAEYGALKQFGLKPFDNGFTRNYNAITNSCVDFVWKALEHAGLNPRGYQGTLLPWNNIDDVRRFMELPVVEQNRRRQAIDEFVQQLFPWTNDLVMPRWNDAIDQIKQQAQIAARYVSPIILDLNGDGTVGTVGLGAGVHFDHAADGFAERTGWVAPGDGLLVWDRNGNGTIDSGRELFGAESVLPHGLKAVNGFEALRALDANGDGVIDARDPVFAQLRVWVDAGTDGHTGAGELRTLPAAGVGSYTTTAGQTRLATDVGFQANATHRIDIGFGIVSTRSLREAANGQAWRIRACGQIRGKYGAALHVCEFKEGVNPQ